MVIYSEHKIFFGVHFNSKRELRIVILNLL
jgi:hypothetical protein